MSGLPSLLRDNSNYRYTWLGQIVSEVGDHFNSVAVLSLALHLTGSGVAVGGVMIARALPAMLAGPLSGVLLDRFDRRKIMIASDLFRFVVALCFILILTHQQRWLLYALSGLLMFASPFFTSGRSAILPRIASPEQLHAANALTQTTSWITLTIGTFLGGAATMQFGYEWAFVVNAISFLVSALAIFMLRSPEGHFRATRADIEAHHAHAFWSDFRESVSYMRATPLILAVALVICRLGQWRWRGSGAVYVVRRDRVQARTCGHRDHLGGGRPGLGDRRNSGALVRAALRLRGVQERRSASATSFMAPPTFSTP